MEIVYKYMWLILKDPCWEDIVNVMEFIEHKIGN